MTTTTVAVSHGSDLYGEERRSTTQVAALVKQLSQLLPGADWAHIRAPFDAALRGEKAEVEPGHAAQIAIVLRRAAADWLMPTRYEREALLFAEAADRAVGAGEPWEWST
ncbi:hypothetical protein [Streptomyces sp. NPDC048309]|uniref:DUF7739 domain-containing protein n=1 Tax=Streptomyces sp. NPDC048309 TaxID=3154618 RepID=UPI0033F048B9